MYDVTSGFRVFGDIWRTIHRRDFRLPKLDSSSNSGSDGVGPTSVRHDRFFAMTSYISVTFLSDIKIANFYAIALKFLRQVNIHPSNVSVKHSEVCLKTNIVTNV